VSKKAPIKVTITEKKKEIVTITIIRGGDDTTMHVDPPPENLRIIAETLIEALVAQSRASGMSHALIAEGLRQAADDIAEREDDGEPEPRIMRAQ
jgi:hypothetical protein